VCPLFIILNACTEKFAPIPDSITKVPLGICDCDPTIPEYIRADFNGTTICFNSITNVTDTFNNAYYTNSSIHLDHINLIRENVNKTMSCQLHFINPDLHNKSLPYILPHANPAYNEYAEIVLSDLDKAWAENIEDDYIGNTYKGFSITITDTSGGYLKGTFHGEANTDGGKRVIINNGNFYVHVIAINENQ